ICEYDSPERLMQFGTFLRQLESVSKADIFPYVAKLESNTITVHRGDLINLTNLHLRLLKYLEEDPRMPVIDLAKISGLTAKRTRKLVRELLESSSVQFSANVELGNAGSIPFLLRIHTNESKKTQLEMSLWLREEFPLEIWENFPCVSEPLLFSLLCVNELNQVDQITRNVRGQEFVNSVLVMISTHHRYFLGLRKRRLKQMIESIDNS
ncbi:MAG: winged helix-turn-helix domain-containing protein, partial [Candidatus Thorarchaeota archaeon]